MNAPCPSCGKPRTVNDQSRADRPCRDCYHAERNRAARADCPRCGKPRMAHNVKSDAPCKDCQGDLKREREHWKEDSRVDWAAVEWVIQGRTASLNADEKKLVVRRMAHRLMDASENFTAVPPGRLTSQQLGARMGINGGHVAQILKRLPPAEKRRCPECRGDMWVLADGTVEQHGNGFHDRCVMSGEPADRYGLAAIRPDLYLWLPGLVAL